MQKFLTLTVLVLGAILLAGCPTGADNGGNNTNNNGGGQNADVIGTWKTPDNSLILEIGDGTWTFSGPGGPPFSGTWTRNANILSLVFSEGSFGTATLTSGENYFYRTVTAAAADRRNCQKSGQAGGAVLKINNQSSKNLEELLWQSVYAPGKHGTGINRGTSSTFNVEAGSGYIYFQIESNSTAFRTYEMVIVENGETKTFTFTNSTVVVEVDNPNSTGTLGTF
jgi:hypothetical protein